MTQTSRRKSNQKNSSSANSRALKRLSHNGDSSSNLSKEVSTKTRVMEWWQSKSLRYKTTALAIALGVLPTLIVGTIISATVANTFGNQIEATNQKEATAISAELKLFLRDGYEDIKNLAQLVENSTAFSNNNRAKLSQELNKFLAENGTYNSIAIFDNQGNVVAQTQGDSLGNHLNRSYIQAAKAADGAVVSEPLVSTSSGLISLYFASVLKNPETGQNQGFIRTRIPMSQIQKLIASNEELFSDKDVYLVNESNHQLFLSSQDEFMVRSDSGEQMTDESGEQFQLVKIEDVYKNIEWSEDQSIASAKDYNQLKKEQQTLAYLPVQLNFEKSNLDWKAIVAGDNDTIFAPVNRILGFLFLGTIASAVIVGYIAYLLAKKGIAPLEETSQKLKKIEAGDLDVQMQVKGDDELAQLGKTINRMTAQMKNLLVEQQGFARQADLLKNITLEMTRAYNINEVFEIAVKEIRGAIEADRVIVYLFDENWQGTIIAESVDNKYPEALGAAIYDPCFADKYVGKYLDGRVQATPDIYKAGLTECHLKQLEPFEVKANLVTPIIANDKLLGLLIAHQCDGPHEWTSQEIEFLSQSATQMSPAIERVMLMETQQIDTFLAQKLKDAIFSIAAALNQEKVFEVATKEAKDTLGCDRVIVYLFDEDWQGTIIAESVDEKYPKALGANIKDPCFADRYVDKYKQGRVQATPDIYKAGLTECHLQQLEPFEVKANLVTPIVVTNELLGLLIAHQCDGPREWSNAESNYLAQLATQIGPAIERINLLNKQQQSEEEQRQARQALQQRALELLMQVDPVSQGDLTIRASVTEDEIGTIADSYNATIENLRKIVTQVKGGSQAVSEVVGEQKDYVVQLNQDMTRQTQDISNALEQIQTLAFSARTVLDNAEQAEAVVAQANRSVEEGEVAMNRTVDGILAIRETVAETAKKVKRLGESTQKISRVVNLISSFADQTNLLALNASIEAAHAGEEGRGFAVVAEEVRSLARQSAEATAEIEKVVAEIQEETNDVVQAMEAGTEQVVEGTRLVEETRSSLTDITSASAQISQLVLAISSSAAEQSKTSEEITETMADVANIAMETTDAVNRVSGSFNKLLEVSENLQESVSQFKVDE